MANKEIELQSGAKLSITTAPFADAHALLKALLKSAQGLPLAQNPMQMDVSVLKEAVLNAAVSDEVEQAIFKCCQRVAYNGIKVTKDIFDQTPGGMDPRPDYYLICWHVIEENCGPFFVQAFSVLKERLKTPGAIPKQS
jgi:hypothetical protein